MKPKILSICGSPRKDGNTAVLLHEALKGAGEAGAETEEIFLLDYNIGFCDGCEKCYVNDGREIGETAVRLRGSSQAGRPCCMWWGGIVPGEFF